MGDHLSLFEGLPRPSNTEFARLCMCVARALNYSNLTAQAKAVIVRTKWAHTRHQHRRSITLSAMSPHAPHDDNWRRKTCRQFRAKPAPTELYNGNTDLCCPNEEWTLCRVKLL
ncbi:hypothetical protein NC651_020305 [Populus alba x Populus x berolinensis]|nr:hypothetical protein NC651_020305 [Populus alba x Populus x berolinensis]